ncbi:MAG: P-loop NTPase fold protein [Oscillospiraceae bacterium]|nr:P-loop NTPase fold protein [Oscillospiraceae bacterium]
MFSSDKPIESSQNDKLNRKSFAKQLAQAILSYKDQENFTIGLYGKWGTGKTSLINMIVEEISEQTYGDINKPIIVKFNPWNYSDKTQLINQFFHTILTEIGTKPSSESLKTVGSALQKYSAVLDYTQYIPVVGEYLKPLKALVSGTGKSIYEAAKNKESLEKLKVNVITALKNQTQKIIVIIDDIDRLNNEQIRLIFQLVNCVAGFPNMIYLLSFDKSVVVRALEEEQKCNGEEYLEKIIQVPFEVPMAKVSDVHNMFFERLSKLLFEEIPCENFDNEYWSTVFSNSISPFISTIRDINRVINVYRFKYGLLHDETNCIDLLAITTLQICAPSIFEWVKNNIDRVIGSAYGTNISFVEQGKNKKQILQEFERVYDQPQMMLDALRAIFPKLSRDTGEYSRNLETEDELRYAQKIACNERTPLYFSLSIEDVAVPKYIIGESINKYDSKQLDELFDNLNREGVLSQYIKELNSHIKDMHPDRYQLFLEKLINMQTYSFENESKGILNISPVVYCEKCCWTIFKTIGNDKTYDTLKYLIDSTDDKSFSIVTNMIVDIEEAFGRIGDSPSSDYKVVPEDRLFDLEASVIDRIRSVTEHRFIFGNKFWQGIYRFWNYKDNESLQLHIREGLVYSDNIPYYLDFVVSYWSSGKKYGWNFNEKCINEYIATDDAYQKITSLKNTDSFSKLDYNVKEITVAFYLWYNSDRKEYHDISKENVDALIPEWEI